jgi:4-hydroxybutyrate dehydrogenase
MALIQYNVKVQFDFGALKLLPEELAQQGVKRPLLVTDKGVAASGIVGKVRALLGGTVPMFDECPSNPTEAAAEAAFAAYRDGGCDGLVAVGGGSAMDLAKAAAVLTANDGPLERYAFYNAGMAFPPRLPAPLFVVPTTAGTGSEVARSAVLIFRGGRKSLLFTTPGTVRCAILDPELTLGLPPSITAATGMDALAHCIETYCSPRVNPPADAIALDGMRRIGAHLERAVRDGGDRQARWEMMMAAMEGALAFQKGMGAVHALSHPLGALGLHHGTLNAVLLPHVLAYNAEALGPKLATMAEALGVGGLPLPQWLTQLNRRLSLPEGLGAMGAPQPRCAEFAAEAMSDSSHATNPRPMQRDDYENLLRAAW